MKLESEANWVKASGQDGLEIQEMVKDVISNVVAQNNFDPVKDVQVQERTFFAQYKSVH